MSLSKKHHLYWGTIFHRRHTPFTRFFKYPIFMAYIDITSLSTTMSPSLLWNINKPAIVSFRRSDYHGDPQVDLEDAVRLTLLEKTGRSFNGPIRLLTNLRYFGYCFNPVSFYYCFNEADDKVEAIMAEVTNTPWGERCCYVLSDNLNKTTSSIKKYQPIKKMHVSPFMPMEIDYEWTFTKPEQKINVSMSNSEEGNKFFNVGLRMKRNNISSYALARILLVYPLITLKIIFGIHWQALRLWLKKCPIYVHPSKI